mgnify:CR=1 FL=1
MFRVNKNVIYNGSMGYINSRDRQRSAYESFTRIGLNSFPAGRSADIALNSLEFVGHRTRDNFNAYYQNNAMGHKDDFERSWDAYKRATDIDYTGGGNDCKIF